MPDKSSAPNAPRGDVVEVVGLFHSSDKLESAISDLASAGWDRADLSLLGQKNLLVPDPPAERDMHDAARHPAEGTSAVVSDTDVRQGRTLMSSLAGIVAAFATSGVVVATGGTALAALAGAAVAGGGAAAVANATGQWADKSRSAFMQEQLARGGIMLWVQIHSPEQENLAHEILARHGAEIIDQDNQQGRLPFSR